jgi:hypothetical protein
VLQLISVWDIGRFGLWAFNKHRELNGCEIDIAGDACTMPQAAEIIGEVADIDGRADEAHIKPLTFSKWAEGANWS